uniref:DUF7771 domain-containing protein n=1 Tax=Setaria italica TaxID=4555 RepID=K3YKU1_SETIT
MLAPPLLIRLLQLGRIGPRQDPIPKLHQRLRPGATAGLQRGTQGPKVTYEWGCDGNEMTGVVVWDEQWPEARSCWKDDSDWDCRLVFEGNREVVLSTIAGRRVLGNVAIKECSKNLWGYGECTSRELGFSPGCLCNRDKRSRLWWLPFHPFGLGCTYPKHDHEYYGTIKS